MRTEYMACHFKSNLLDARFGSRRNFSVFRRYYPCTLFPASQVQFVRNPNAIMKRILARSGPTRTAQSPERSDCTFSTAPDSPAGE